MRSLFLLSQGSYCNYWYLLTILLFFSGVNASESKKEHSWQKNVVIPAIKDALPFTIIGNLSLFWREYSTAKKQKELPRLNKFRVKRAFATSVPASTVVFFMTYQYHKIKHEISKAED